MQGATEKEFIENIVFDPKEPRSGGKYESELEHVRLQGPTDPQLVLWYSQNSGQKARTLFESPIREREPSRM